MKDQISNPIGDGFDDCCAVTYKNGSRGRSRQRVVLLYGGASAARIESCRIQELEALDEMSEKANAIAEKHYGSKQAMMDAAKKRNEFAPTLTSSLAREVSLK